MSTIADHILALPAWIALLLVFLLPALESSAFVGFVFPGEIALILGGVIASQGRLPLAAVLVAAILGCVIGDTVGYVLGRRFGRRVLDGSLGRFVKAEHLDRAERYLAERGGKAVFLGRFTAALRVLVPGLAGMARMRYLTFAAFNVAGALCWGTAMVLLGFLAGNSWRRIEHIASRAGLAALAVVVLGFAFGYLLRHSGRRWARRLVAAVTEGPTARRLRARHPRATGWVAARLDPESRTGLALTAGVAVAVAATWLFLGVTQDVVAHEELALLDPRIHGWVVAHRVPALNVFFEAVTWLGSSLVVVPVLLVTALVLVRRRGSWAPLVRVALVYLSAVTLHAVVAELVRRPRPPRADWLSAAHGWAFPSGHTTEAVVTAGLLTLLLGAGASPRRRLGIGLVAAVLAVLVGASRVYLGVHWPSDVLGAGALALAVLAVGEVVRRSQSWWSPEGRPHGRTAPEPQPTEDRPAHLEGPDVPGPHRDGGDRAAA